MPIFGTKEIEALRLRVQQLSEKLKRTNESLAKSTKDLTTLQLTHTQTKADLSQRTEELRVTKSERDAAQQSLAEFEKSLRASLRQLGTMLEIVPSRWVDPAAVWHVYIQPPHSVTNSEGETVPIHDYTLYLNNQAISQGPNVLMMSKAQAVIDAKSKV